MINGDQISVNFSKFVGTHLIIAVRSAPGLLFNPDTARARLRLGVDAVDEVAQSVLYLGLAALVAIAVGVYPGVACKLIGATETLLAAGM